MPPSATEDRGHDAPASNSPAPHRVTPTEAGRRPLGQRPQHGQRGRHGLGWLLVVGGLVGLVAAVALLVEKIALLKNPDHIPSCDLNPVLSCGSVMITPQAEAFGIPNPIIGIAGFAALVVFGASVLAASGLPRWFWFGAQVGVTFGVVFVHWLIYQSLYVIGALCPYCMVVWVVTIAVFWSVTVCNLRPFGGPERGGVARLVAVVTEYRGALLTAWYLVIIGLIAARFWDYWTTLI